MRRVVERNLLQREIGLAHRPIDCVAQSRTVSVVRPRKSNFTRPMRSTSFMSNCEIVLSVPCAAYRGKVVSFPARSDPRLHADVAREALELPGEREQLARSPPRSFPLGQARLHRARVLEGDALAGWNGMSFASSSVRV